MIDSGDFIRRVRAYLTDSFGLVSEDVQDDTALFTDGYLDSFNMTALVAWLEEEYAIKFGVFDITTDNLDSIEKMRDFVTSKSGD